MKNFYIVTDGRRIGKNFIFQGFRFEKSKILRHLNLFNWMGIESFKKKMIFGSFCFRSFAHEFFRPFGPSRMRTAMRNILMLDILNTVKLF